MASPFSTEQLVPWPHLRGVTVSVAGENAAAYPLAATMDAVTILMPFEQFFDLVWRAKTWDVELHAACERVAGTTMGWTWDVTGEGFTRLWSKSVTSSAERWIEAPQREPILRLPGGCTRKTAAGVETTRWTGFLPQFDLFHFPAAGDLTETITMTTVAGVPASAEQVAAYSGTTTDISYDLRVWFRACRILSSGEVEVGVSVLGGVADTVDRIFSFRSDATGTDTGTLFGHSVPLKRTGATSCSLSLAVTPTSWWF